MEEVTDLGAGFVFGSKHINEAREINFTEAQQFAKEKPSMATSILLFDWWIKNTDRTLGENGGNPNIFVSAVDSNVWMIDHNLAFSLDGWDETRFFRNHIFGSCRTNFARIEILEIFPKMLQITTAKDPNILQQIWELLPHEWLFLDEDKTCKTEFSLEEVIDVTSRLSKKKW